MSPKRYGMYLSPDEDAQLLQELDNCTIKGRKSELLRNYALLGYQKALDLCSEIEDTNKLTAELAALFGAQGSQHDFRQAAEFVRARNLQKEQSGGGRTSSPSIPADAKATEQRLPPRTDGSSTGSLADETPTEPAAVANDDGPKKPKTSWAQLGGLVSKPSKPDPQGNE